MPIETDYIWDWDPAERFLLLINFCIFIMLLLDFMRLLYALREFHR